MKTAQSAMMMLFIASALLITACAAYDSGSPGSSTAPAAATMSASPAVQTNAASGTQDDTLQACMARIPQDTSAGLRMIAEQSCERDEANRKAILSVPGTK
ncbi:MAG TPA: hypothetical protein VJM82_02775 [Nitrospiraceae bacterium]|nr:hypothetical protein [Nitrospiraceae bacterium]